jgi:hypothetical protein
MEPPQQLQRLAGAWIAQHLDVPLEIPQVDRPVSADRGRGLAAGAEVAGGACVSWIGCCGCWQPASTAVARSTATVDVSILSMIPVQVRHM